MDFLLLQVSGVAFDSYWSSPASDETEENVVYRFGSVGQVLLAIPCAPCFSTYLNDKDK